MMTSVYDTDYRPGDLVAFTNTDGEEQRLPVSRTWREEPSLGKLNLVEVIDDVRERCDHYKPDDLRRVRCVCCDGPDGNGYHHVAGGLDALHAFVANKTGYCPIAFDDRLARGVVFFDTIDEADRYIIEVIEGDADAARYARRARGRRA